MMELLGKDIFGAVWITIAPYKTIITREKKSTMYY